METGILGFIGSKNIGDYIQTKAVIDLVGSKNIKILDRENLETAMNVQPFKRYLCVALLDSILKHLGEG